MNGWQVVESTLVICHDALLRVIARPTGKIYVDHESGRKGSVKFKYDVKNTTRNKSHKS